MKKFMVSFLTVIMILLIAFPVAAFEMYPPSHYVMGDITGDYKINAQDALVALQYQVSKSSYEYFVKVAKIVLDVSGDERVDAKDALHILQYAVGKRTTFDNNDLSGLQDLVYP